MPQSLADIWIHLIFSTKHRQPWLEDERIREELFRYMSSICTQMDSIPRIVGGVADHAHLLFRQSKNHPLAKIIKSVKGDSSIWIKKRWPGFHEFYWQRGYGAFSVSPRHVDVVEKYIARQEEHHRDMGYQDEFRFFLNRHQIPYEERFLWD